MFDRFLNMLLTFIKLRKFLKDNAYEKSKRNYESDDYSSNEKDNFLADING